MKTLDCVNGKRDARIKVITKWNAFVSHNRVPLGSDGLHEAEGQRCSERQATQQRQRHDVAGNLFVCGLSNGWPEGHAHAAHVGVGDTEEDADDKSCGVAVDDRVAGWGCTEDDERDEDEACAGCADDARRCPGDLLPGHWPDGQSLAEKVAEVEDGDEGDRHPGAQARAGDLRHDAGEDGKGSCVVDEDGDEAGPYVSCHCCIGLQRAAWHSRRCNIRRRASVCTGYSSATRSIVVVFPILVCSDSSSWCCLHCGWVNVHIQIGLAAAAQGATSVSSAERALARASLAFLLAVAAVVAQQPRLGARKLIAKLVTGSFSFSPPVCATGPRSLAAAAGACADRPCTFARLELHVVRAHDGELADIVAAEGGALDGLVQRRADNDKDD
eukprot:m.69708 g.69708  ORF g.69708 m.69708 type:complete len:386 (-) comp14265_c2_seq1:658-1815(-)